MENYLAVSLCVHYVMEEKTNGNPIRRTIMKDLIRTRIS